MSKEKHQQIMFEAVDSDLGKKVRTNSPEKLRQKLYNIRKANSIFACLHFVIPAGRDDELWIIKKPEIPDA